MLKCIFAFTLSGVSNVSFYNLFCCIEQCSQLDISVGFLNAMASQNQYSLTAQNARVLVSAELCRLANPVIITNKV